ncbi:hypothetical protein SAMN05444920_102863 [Nonomuraea solani]|uniref:Uncharacterized protein n=1 Tax=Nonomuraea solani TaxID=1144553 RepID=A0A1H5ZTQ7_9ACTN|nr:hypothetical protein [Nonomuraea solani]SEG39591.1 hypothetical protein SAMN05444920_102863 [Nonomuraea solani]
MLTDEMRRSRPHEVHARGVRSEDRDEIREPGRTVHRLRRIRKVQGITGQAPPRYRAS